MTMNDLTDTYYRQIKIATYIDYIIAENDNVVKNVTIDVIRTNYCK